MPLLTQDELNPLQAARRVAEEHLDAIREIATARLKALPNLYSRDDQFGEENDRYFKIAAVVDALQTIYDNVSELEFEEEQPPAPPEEPEEDEPDEEDEDEDEDPEE